MAFRFIVSVVALSLVSRLLKKPPKPPPTPHRDQPSSHYPPYAGSRRNSTVFRRLPKKASACVQKNTTVMRMLAVSNCQDPWNRGFEHFHKIDASHVTLKTDKRQYNIKTQTCLCYFVFFLTPVCDFLFFLSLLLLLLLLPPPPPPLRLALGFALD